MRRSSIAVAMSALLIPALAGAQDAMRGGSGADPAAAMPADPILYVELDAPGENLLALLRIAAETNGHGARARKLLENPIIVGEIRKLRSIALAVTGGEVGRPTGVAVLAVEKTSALRTLLSVLIPAGGERWTHRGIEISTIRSHRGEISVAFGEDLAIFGYPAGEVSAALDRLAGAAPSLADAGTFQQAVARRAGSGSVIAYADGPRLLAALAAIHPPTERDRFGAKLLELDRIGSLSMEIAFGDSLTIESAVRFSGAVPRIAEILHTPRLDPSLLGWLPADTAVAFAYALGDGEAKWAEFVRFAEEMYDEALRAGIPVGERPSAALANFEAGLGLSVGRDIIGNIASAALAVRRPGREHDDPPIFVARVKDPAAAERTARTLLARAAEHATGAPLAVERDASATVPVDKVRISDALEPACAIVGDILVMGPTPGRVREAIAARDAAGILGGARIPEGAVKLLVLRPSVLARELSGREGELWAFLAEAAGDAPVLVWTEEGDGRAALKLRIPNLRDLLAKIAARAKRI